MPEQQNDMQSQKQKASPSTTEDTQTKKENPKVNMEGKEDKDPSSCGPSGCSTGSC